MRQILSNMPEAQVLEQLDISLQPTSPYVLVENGFSGVDNSINIHFDPSDLAAARVLLEMAGYYKTQVIRHLIGRHHGDAHIVPLSEIVYIEGINNDTYLHTKDMSYELKDKLYQLDEKLLRYKFVRISKSYIVSVYHIEKIKTTFQGKLLLILTGNTQLEVTRHYVSTFKQVLGM